MAEGAWVLCVEGEELMGVLHIAELVVSWILSGLWLGRNASEYAVPRPRVVRWSASSSVSAESPRPVERVRRCLACGFAKQFRSL